MNARKARTEPPLPKKSNFLPNEANNSCTSPSRTPPWRPMSSFTSYGMENTPVGPTRQRLFFYDFSDDELPSPEKANENQRSRTPSPIRHLANKLDRNSSLLPLPHLHFDDDLISPDINEQI